MMKSTTAATRHAALSHVEVGAGNRTAARRARSGAIAFLALVICVLWAKPMGLLLWARIRILTSIPRTAIADDVLAAALRDAAREAHVPEPLVVELHATPMRDPFVSND